jgi:hypothetical protein
LWKNSESILGALRDHAGPLDTVVHGDCRGADRLADEAAKTLCLRVERYPADWNKYGRSAGPIRNHEMLDTGIDLVLAFHDDLSQSEGTNHMVTIATKAGVLVKTFDK